jgi:hypothetical protein
MKLLIMLLCCFIIEHSNLFLIDIYIYMKNKLTSKLRCVCAICNKISKVQNLNETYFVNEVET